MTETPHANRSALVVEDETIIAMLIEDMLTELGCGEVRCAGSVAAGMAALDAKNPDFVILDVNLGGSPAFPIAERLAGAGVPFLFTTGYGVAGLPPKMGQPPCPAEAILSRSPGRSPPAPGILVLSRGCVLASTRPVPYRTDL